ncbi:hypothetical protein Hanom_Chr08g00738071 [Helianthus anomalus]
MWTKCLQSARRRGFVFFFYKKLFTHNTHKIYLSLPSRSLLSLYNPSTPPPIAPPPPHHLRHHTTASLSLRSLSLSPISLSLSTGGHWTSTTVAVNNINSTIVLSAAMNREVARPSPRRFLSL